MDRKGLPLTFTPRFVPPDADRFPTEADQDRERQRIFHIIEELVKWDNTNNETILDAARLEIAQRTLASRTASTRLIRDRFEGGITSELEALETQGKAFALSLGSTAVIGTQLGDERQ